MTLYKDTDGDSNIKSYEYDVDSITVEFKDGSRYKYPKSKAGSFHVEKMKQLADRGDGLLAYINRYVKDKYIKIL